MNWFIEAGVITTVGDDWHVLDERLEEAHVPATLRSVLQARLDALSEAERVALQRASVVGRVFWDDAVDCLGSGDSMPAAEIATAAALDQLRTREIVFERERSTFDAQPGVPVQARPPARRRVRRDAAAPPPFLPSAGGTVVRADGRALAAAGRVRRPDRRPLRQQRRSRRGCALVPRRRAAGGRGARVGRRPAPARRRHRPAPGFGGSAALRPGAGAGDGARPDRRPGRPARRPRCPRRARDVGRRRPGPAHPVAPDALSLVVPPERVRRPRCDRARGDRPRSIASSR